MRMPPDYLASLRAPPDATLLALVTGGASEPMPPTVGFGLSMAGVLGDVEAVDDATRERLDSDARWAVSLRLPRPEGGEPELVWIWLAPAPTDWLGALFDTDVRWKGVLPEDRTAALSSECAVHVRRSLDGGMLEEGDAPLVRFHWLARVLDAVCSDATFVIDVDATLMNEPYAIAAMSEGQRGRHELALLSDWQILCEHGSFGPDQIGHLERIVAPDD